MEERGHVGLFIAPDKAVAVWVDADGAPMGHLCIRSSEEEPGAIALQTARAVMAEGRFFDEVFVAVDCGYYTQYKLHSEFDDYNQIESTIKFDAEEAAATDAMNLAVTFEITGKQQVGSEVTVYTADRQLLTDILLDVQEGGLDPTLIEPDVTCLKQALMQDAEMLQSADALYFILTESSCYMIRPQADFTPRSRTFLIGKGQNVTQVLSREVMREAGISDTEHALKSAVLIGHTEAVDTDLLAQRTGLEIRTQFPPKSLQAILTRENEIASHELMIAYGAALTAGRRGHKTDFRRDFMPYQGRRKVLEGSLKLMAIAATILLAAVAVFFQIKTIQAHRYVNQIEDKLEMDHRSVVYGKRPNPGLSVVSSLRTQVSRAKKPDGGGLGDDKSVPAKLTYFLKAINQTPKNVDINLRQVTVTERSMTVKGNTNSQSGAMQMVNQIKKDPQITVNGERYSASSGRYTFQFNVEPKKTQGTRR